MVDAAADVVGDLAPSGVLRAAINLGNPVLAQGSADAPAGVTVAIARAVADRLGVPVEFVCFDAARKSYQAMISGAADICFLAIEPAREADVAFTAPYVVIEGVFAVPQGSPLRTVADVDAPGVRIAVKQGSAYDLYLTRTLRHATLVRGAESIEVFRAGGVEAVAGIRQPLTGIVAADPDLRLIDERFMQIRQAVGTTRDRAAGSIEFLRASVEALKADGTVAAALRDSHQSDTLLAPPAG
ncbi:ABC transporter substrate-binding protein [Actinocatenispora thailandica]|uniref:ABC transporter substrate-binding protein n=1 Tax=Actinocatenispora thailandica TaxID=227318 RepID=A0A7R7HYA9_9ACTN|nr:transporter substrate-binding domain-containing protein [Actinocatenispora thailandica]BCJ35873.1 ABC transporter substrate-binding protein [Actinocatenispora thailandica]